MEDNQALNKDPVRIIALTIVVAGAVGSLYFMFNAGRNQKSIFVIACFTAWVLSPFIGLFLVNKMANHWTAPTRASLYWFMIVLTIGSLVAYSGAFNTPHTKTAFTFLVLPFVSWLLISIITLIARESSRKIK